eukprot:GCRY01001005.1.p1 GENE.GCRY01001005.1~~GCRY01001005.1.p1  ORF type:complete len:348 (-),score=49.96 GCRY01001005.1:630-1673(-)
MTIDNQVSNDECGEFFQGKTILVTGGTGSFGKKFLKRILNYNVKKVIVFSRDELKQFEMSKGYFKPEKFPQLRYFIGDVRDQPRLKEAFRGVDIIVHAAALKQVPAIEYNPFEAIKTNILGANNIISAAIESGVKQVIALSTDKAANPVNLYGATKLCSDKLFISANQLAPSGSTTFSVVRYGNVVASRGSVIPFFKERAKTGLLPITHDKMTRFSITLDEGVEFVFQNLMRMQGGEIFIPKIPSYKILDVAQAVAPEAEVKIVGIRPGEKLHEIMVPVDEARNTVEYQSYFVIQPSFPWWEARKKKMTEVCGKGTAVPEGFSYSSDNNTEWLSVDELSQICNSLTN